MPRIQNALQSIPGRMVSDEAPPCGSRRTKQDRIIAVGTPHRLSGRSELQALYEKFEAEIEKLNQRVEEQACQRLGARLLMTHPGVGPITALATEKCS